jgi:protein tyrosine phosphatase (PTP) superfamily phosphohydrolase (DUF442 family)
MNPSQNLSGIQFYPLSMNPAIRCPSSRLGGASGAARVRVSKDQSTQKHGHPTDRSHSQILFCRTSFLIILATGLAVVLSGFAAETNHLARPASWAKPLTASGIENFFQVTTNLYRGAQPTAEGMKQLQARGIKTVINLRAYHSDKDEVAGTGLNSVRFESEPWDADEKDVVRFLQVVADTNNLPAFVHCQRGADRTGMMCAMYRICIGGWTKADAIEEMKEGGFGFNPAWRNLVRLIEKADVEKLKREAGVDSLKR